MTRAQPIDPQWIVDYYRELTAPPKLRLEAPLELVTLTNTGHGLGDTVILSDLPRAAAHAGAVASVYSQSPYFPVLMSLNPHFEERILPFWAAADRLCAVFDLGNGHIIQRLRRAFGYAPDPTPAGCLSPPNASPGPKRAVFHFEPGYHAVWQRRHVHPRAREVYAEHLADVQRFVLGRPDWEFFEVGSTSSGLKKVVDATGRPLEQTIALMASCRYFVGVISGPLHVAAALGLRVVAIVNFPPPAQIVLPTLKDLGRIESEWLYPQSVILHQEGSGGTTYRFSLQNLERAFAGELYPYWSDRYLGLIETPV
jgi:hypothetical protein